MIWMPRFAVAVALPLALVVALAAGSVQGRAEEPAASVAGTNLDRACLGPKERRAEADSGKLVRLAAAMRVAHARMPGTVVRARLCHGADGLVYVLTVLARDGKVARIEVDAVKGTLAGGL